MAVMAVGPSPPQLIPTFCCHPHQGIHRCLGLRRNGWLPPYHHLDHHPCRPSCRCRRLSESQRQQRCRLDRDRRARLLQQPLSRPFALGEREREAALRLRPLQKKGLARSHRRHRCCRQDRCRRHLELQTQKADPRRLAEKRGLQRQLVEGRWRGGERGHPSGQN